MERKQITNLIGAKIASVDTSYTGTLRFLDKRGKVLFQVKQDDIFDGDGNYFDTDSVPYRK